MVTAPVWPDWPPDANRELRRLISRLRRLGIEVKDAGLGTIGGWEEVADVELPGFTAGLPGSPGNGRPGFRLNVRYHPFRRIWVVQTQPDVPGLLGRLPKPVAFQLLRRGARNDAREIARTLQRSSPDLITIGSVRGATGGSPLTDVVETAVITAAVVPFVQAIATKAGEDSYQWLKKIISTQTGGQNRGRHSLRARPGKNQAEQAAQAPGSQKDSYIYDPAAMTLLIIPGSAREEALRGLSATNIDDIRGKVLIWDPGRGSWIPASPAGSGPPEGLSGPDRGD